MNEIVNFIMKHSKFVHHGVNFGLVSLLMTEIIDNSALYY